MQVLDYELGAIAGGILIAAVRQQLLNAIDAFSVWRTRNIGIDKPGDTLQIKNSSSGAWGIVTVKNYRFWELKKKLRGVEIVTIDGACRTVDFDEWAKTGKQTVPEGDEDEG